MSAHGPPEAHAPPPATALGRFANSMDAFLRPFYTWLCYVAAAVLGLLILTILYSIIGRRLGAALPGSQEIIEQSLVIIVFGAMGLEHMGHEKMSVDVIARHLPKRVQMVIAPIIYIQYRLNCSVTYRLTRTVMYTYDGSNRNPVRID